MGRRRRERGDTEARGEAPERERQTTGAEECETEYEPVEAGLRDEGGLPTFSVRQQELGGKANLDGQSIPTARDDHSRTVTGWQWMGICATTADMRGMGSRHGQPGMRNETVAAALAAAASLVIRRTSDQILQSRCTCLWGARRRLCPCRTPASRRMAL